MLLFLRRRAFWLAGLTWLVVVLAVYYRRAWRLLAEGPRAFDLAAIRPQALRSLLVVAGLAAVCLGVALATRLAASARRPSDERPWYRRAEVYLVIGEACAAGFLVGVTILAVRPGASAGPLSWIGEASRRCAAAIAGAGLVGAAAWFCGGPVCRLVGAPPAFLYRVGLGFGAVSYLSLALAFAGLYRAAVIVPVLSAVTAAGVLIGVREWASRTHVLLTDAKCVRPPRAAPVKVDLLWAAIALLGLGLALVGALAPEVEYDALWYHLWLPRLWLEHGRPVDVLAEYVSLYPLTWELLFGDAMAVGGAVGAKLLHFACLPLTALAAWQLTRRFFRPASPWLASALVVTVPLLFWEATTAYVDLALALYVTLGVYALLRHLDERDNRWLRSSAVAFGLGAAVKHLGLVVAALVCMGLLVGAVPREHRRARVAAAFTVGLTALALALPWYWRAWAASGNPFFPELFTVFGAGPPARWDAISERGLDAFKAHFGFPRTPINLALLPWNITQHGAAFGGCIGPLFLASLPWLAARYPQRAATRWLVYLVTGYVAVWASPISSFQLRFLVPILPLLAVLSAAAFTHLFTALRPPRARRAASAVLALLMVLHLPPFIPLHEGDREGWTGWVTHVTRIVPLPVVVGRESGEEYLQREVATYGAWRYLAATAPRTAVVLEVGGGDNFYATRERIGMDATLARGAWAEGNAAADKVVATLHRLAVTHLVMDKSWVPRLDREGAVLGSAEFRRERLRLLFEDERGLVYLVLPAKSSTTHRSFLPNWRSASAGW